MRPARVCPPTRTCVWWVRGGRARVRAWCAETDLHAVIRAGILEEIHKQYIIYQLLKSLYYMHTAELIHRDVKPSNLLLNSDCHAKLCDFGLCRSVSEMSSASAPVLTDYVATRWYRGMWSHPRLAALLCALRAAHWRAARPRAVFAMRVHEAHGTNWSCCPPCATLQHPKFCSAPRATQRRWTFGRLAASSVR
ncbi:hypothetical protein EON67_08270 [archaeon]|nr:MAG: hypothetical protein EON67_08270 [archaeon]